MQVSINYVHYVILNMSIVEGNGPLLQALELSIIISRLS